MSQTKTPANAVQRNANEEVQIRIFISRIDLRKILCIESKTTYHFNDCDTERPIVAGSILKLNFTHTDNC